MLTVDAVGAVPALHDLGVGKIQTGTSALSFEFLSQPTDHGKQRQGRLFAAVERFLCTDVVQLRA
jgi:hypothetical protein